MKKEITFIAGALDVALICYLIFLMGKYLLDGQTFMFLISTIACGVWTISCAWIKEVTNQELITEIIGGISFIVLLFIIIIGGMVILPNTGG